MSGHKARKTREQRRIELSSAFLCIDYLDQIFGKRDMKKLRDATTDAIVNYCNRHLGWSSNVQRMTDDQFKRRRAKNSEELERLLNSNRALILETINAGRKRRLNARIIQKFDSAPLRDIAA